MERLDTNRNEGIFLNREISIHLSRYLPILQYVEGHSILDLGCGEGYSASLFAKHGATNYLGVDISQEAVNKARQNFSEDNVRFHISSIEAAVTNGVANFDVISCVEALEHCSDSYAVVKEIFESCEPNSLVYITFPNDFMYFGLEKSLNRYHETVLSFEGFKNLISGAGFEYVKYGLGFSADGFLNVAEQSMSADLQVSMMQAASQLSSRSTIVSLNDVNLKPENSAYYYAIASKSSFDMEGQLNGAVYPVDCTRTRPGMGVPVASRLKRPYRVTIVSSRNREPYNAPLEKIDCTLIPDVNDFNLKEAVARVGEAEPDQIHFTTPTIANSFFQLISSNNIDSALCERLMTCVLSVEFLDNSREILNGHGNGFFDVILKSNASETYEQSLRRICIAGRRSKSPATKHSRMLWSGC